MPLLAPKDLPQWLSGIAERPPQAVLLFGEPYLCRRALARIEEALLAGGGTLHPIDGDEEDIQDTLLKLANFSLLGALGGRQIYRVSNTRLLYSKKNGRALWDRVSKAKDSGRDDQAKKALVAFLKAADLPLERDALTALPPAQWKKLFDFAKPDENLDWTAALLEGVEAKEDKKSVGGDPGEQLAEMLAKGLPPANTLILLAGEIDKRKKLFKHLKDKEVVIDCAVADGATSQAKREQGAVLEALAAEVLRERGKKLAKPLLDVVLERVGFHPVALVNELEKLALFVGERDAVTKADLDEMVGRTRQEALNELNSEIVAGRLPEALAILARLLDNGAHPLAVVAGLRGQCHNLLLYRSLIDTTSPRFSPAMRFDQFQQHYLPALPREAWPREFPPTGHPYALYNQFRAAAALPLARPARWLHLLLAAERRLKSGGAEPELALHRLIVAMLAPDSPAPALAKSPRRVTIQA